MSTIVTRAGKGSPLTNNEVDSNFTNLNTDKVESITSADGSVVVSSSGTTRDLSVGVAGSTATLISQVRNETGATLTKGTVVYISGAAGNKAVVSKALATGDSTSAQTYGMVQADIPHNQNGYVVVVGAVSGLNTSAFADGTQLYLSGVSAGGYTNTKPYAPTHLVYVGIVTYSHNTQGTIQVKIQNGYELDEIHDVSARSPVDGQTLVYVSSTGLWTKTDQASMSVGSAATLATARNINGVSFNGSADITVADATKLPLAGGTLSGKLTLDGRNEIYGVPTNAGTVAGFMGGTSGGTTAARTQSLNTQTLLNVAALGYTGSGWVGGAGLSFVATENITAANRGTKAVLTAIAAGDSVATTMEFNGSALTINGSTAVTSSNYNTYAPTKTGTGASGTWGINITGNAATATSATDSTKLPLAGGTLTGKVTFPSANADKPQMPNGFLGLDTGDANFDIWGISRDYYPSNATAANAWGIRWDGDSNQIRFIGGGSVRVSFDLDDGATQINSNTVLHAGNYNSYSPTLTGTGASGTWGISISGNSATTSQRAFSGDISATGQGRFTGWYTGNAATGTAAEIGMSSGEGYVFVYNRDTQTYGTLNISSSGANMRFSGSAINVGSGSLQQGGNQVLHAGNYTNYAATVGHNHTYDVNNAWLRDANDDANVKLYGNTRQMVFRTDGTTEFASGIGGYAFAWMYGGDSAAERRMLLASNGRLWTNYHGWMDEAFAPISHTHSYLPLSGGTLSGSIYFPNDSANGIFNAAGNAGYRPDDVYGNTYMFNQSGTNGGWYGDFSGYYFRSSSSSNWLTISGSAVNSSVALQQSGNQVLHAGNYTSYSPSLGGSGASGTWGINISGTASLATNAIRIQYNDGPRDLSDRLPNSFARTVNFDFVGAGTGNGSGNYAGVMTFSPWTGTTASTGDSSYQLSFANTTGVNASGQPKLSIRNGIDSTWNAWYTLLHSGNVGTYALPISGGTISGRVTFQDSTDTQITLNGNGTAWTGITATDSGGTDYLWIYGATGTWSFGGGGSVVSGKKMHIHGGVTIGSGYTATANPSNGLNVEGAIQQAGNQVLHAGNYSSYALPLGGGTLSGKLTISASAGLDLYRLTFDADGTDSWQRAGSGNRHRFTTTGGADFIIGNGSGVATLNGNQLLHAGNYTSYSPAYSYFDDYTRGGYRVIADYSGTNTWYIRSSGQFVWGRSHDWSQAFELYLGNGTTGNANGWAEFGQRQSNNTHGTWFGTRFVQYLSNGKVDGKVRASEYYLGDDSNYITGGGSGAIRSQTSYGYVDVGAQNSSYAHIQTDRPQFYFNKTVYVDGDIYKYTGGLPYLHSGNYSSYALPLSGGTVSGNLYATAEIRLNGSNTARIGWRPAGSGTLNAGFPFALNGATGAINIEVSDNDTGGLMIDNEGVTVYGAGDTGPVFRVIDEDQYQSNGNNITNATQFWVNQDSGTSGFRNQLTIAGSTALHAGNYTSYSPSLTGSGASGTWGISITGNAATVGSKSSTAFHQRAHFGTSDSRSSGYYKVRILAATSWMLSFVVRIYQGYESYDIRISGYNYGGNYWYSPQASLMDGSGTAIDVRFGYDSAYNLWVAFPASNYTGLDVVNVVNGYTQFDGNYADQFAIQYESSLSGSVQTTQTAYRPLKYNENAVSATTASTLQGYGPNQTGGANTIVQRDGNGYIQNSYFYTSGGGTERNGSGLGYFAGFNSSDYYIRSWTAGAAAAAIQTAASGSWGITAARATRANGNMYIDDNYGNTVVGVYSSYRYQGVFAMGDSYKLAADGTSLGTLYGMAWSHPNTGGAAGNLTDHGLLIINNGSFRCAISNSIVASGNITAYSDERLKTNWRDMPEDYVTRLAEVKVGIYDRIDETEMAQVGVSAQSFQKLLPQAIMTAKDEMQTLSVNYGGAALASAVELAKEVVDLRARVAHLESLISKLIGD